MLSHVQFDRDVVKRIDARVAREHQENLWRPTVVTLLESPARNLLFVQSAKTKRSWGPIQGGIHEGESVIVAVLREPKEEAKVYPTVVSGCRFCYTTRKRTPDRPDGFELGKSYYIFHVWCHTTPAVSLRQTEVRAFTWLQPQEVQSFLPGRASPEKVQATLAAMSRAGLA